ncbi:hypothetical protein IMG5_146540 [Ichthyophthirius multifiliis]|uniref:Uncharacterized protein n=1 Tax=Ichthyophthirius multifiliis TaxID=5932 RepID=G0QY12_ICHMU|nr:hypothetical protein IMG5_146540 [Ichthyophthirius multifiliis]EGR29881.1 hypothetical protein IMG5_146540 [Ichthyophthirius multifiliis]|eukprot:XP_004031117.1 hypothetical protein IMG5_146540 [Ichthyophthirius multifiliis]
MDKTIKQKQNEVQELNNQIESEGNNLQELEADTYDMDMKLCMLKLEKNSNIFKISYKQAQSKKYDDLVNKNAKLTYPESQLIIKYQEQKEINNNIQQCIEQLLQEYPQYQQVLAPLIEVQNFEQ